VGSDKNPSNERDHGLSFETAQLVFEDPFALSRLDIHPDEERWQTIGVIGPATVLVVHTTPGLDPLTEEEIGRIVSARKATAHERRAYEEGEF
jgi:uncharacterized DUF497 family protein